MLKVTSAGTPIVHFMFNIIIRRRGEPILEGNKIENPINHIAANLLVVERVF